MAVSPVEKQGAPATVTLGAITPGGSSAIPDYDRLIDARTWDFIRNSESWYPPETTDLPVERQRQIYNAMCRAFHREYPAGIAARDDILGGVSCRVYDGPDPGPATIVYFHGGGYVVGGLESHDSICAEIADSTRSRVVSVAYRLAPENRHPAQFDDAVAATHAVARTFGQPLVLVGDSVGGALAATTSHALRGSGIRIRGQVLIYPMLGKEGAAGSFVTHALAPLLTTRDVAYYAKVRFRGGGSIDGDPTASVLQDHDFAGLPPTLIHVAECDPLADDGPAYVERIRLAGGYGHCVVEAGLVHGYLRARHKVERARRSFATITWAITLLARGEIPWRGAL